MINYASRELEGQADWNWWWIVELFDQVGSSKHLYEYGSATSASQNKTVPNDICS